MNPAVTDYIQTIKLPWQAEVCTALRQIIHQAVPDVAERLQYGKPHFLKNGKYACVMGTAKGWVSFTIFNASGLDAPDGLFEESEETERRTIKFREGQAVDAALLAGLIGQAASTI
jgi:hypothetical protein